MRVSGIAVACRSGYATDSKGANFMKCKRSIKAIGKMTPRQLAL